MAQRIAEQLLLLKRESEALILIEDALRRETRPVDRLYLLFSALSNLGDPDTKLKQHSSQIQEISHFMGIDVPAKYETFSAKITFLRNENIKANRRFTTLMMKNRDLSKDKKTAALKRYIGIEVIKEYKTLAEEALKRLQATNES